LAATAFLHSVMMQEKRGMLKVWNTILVALAFCLSIFGTFLTRSGVVNSIHSFSQSPLGAWFLGFIVLTTVASAALIWLRLPLLRSRTTLESLVSRDATFPSNNLLLVTGGALVAVGLGSSLPGLLAYTFSAFVAASIVYEFARGTRATGSLTRLVARNRRRYGGYLVHAAILLLAVGIAGSSAYQTVRERGLKPGQSMQVA